MIKIYNPIWVNKNGAYFSISKWNFQKEPDPKEIRVEVWQGKKVVGQGIINKSQWIKTAKLKEKKIIFKPDDPMVFYYNILFFPKPKTEEDKWRDFSIQYL